MTEAPDLNATTREILELARLGAEAAAAAYGVLLGHEARATAPAEWPAAPAEPSEAIGVVFELEGDLGGFVALVLPERAQRRLVSALCGEPEPDAARTSSALREAGNILASRAVSAVADHLAARITISIPTVVSDEAEHVLQRLIAKRGAIAAESEIEEEPGAGGARLVFAPDAPSRI